MTPTDLSKSPKNLRRIKKSCGDISDKYQLIINSLNRLKDCYFSIVDRTGKIIFISKEFEDIDGYKVDDILGRNVLDVYKLNEQTSVHMKTIKEKKTMENTLFRYTSADGQIIELVMDIYPIYSEGEIIGSFAVSHDTSKMKTLTDKLFQLQKTFYQQLQKINNNGTRFCFDDIIGPGEGMKNVIATAQKMACSESRIMILGETGTGKELFAQSIHNYSSRAKGPFIAVNCSAIPETLLESTLFGTSKGAFTGAVDKAGLFEEAKNGTLFLDEINSMGIVFQTKLLRALETNSIRRVGSNKEVPINARIISAMNIEPEEAVETGKLRSDFYYRLAVVTLECPSLRNRKEDIIPLSKYFINKYNKILGRKIRGVSEEVEQVLQNYDWPGNVRELSHCIEHAMNMVDPADYVLSKHHLPVFLQKKGNHASFTLSISSSEVDDYKQVMLHIEKNLLTQALKESKGNINQAAKKLNLSRQCLFYKLKRLNINIQHETHIA